MRLQIGSAAWAEHQIPSEQPTQAVLLVRQPGERALPGAGALRPQLPAPRRQRPAGTLPGALRGRARPPEAAAAEAEGRG